MGRKTPKAGERSSLDLIRDWLDAKRTLAELRAEIMRQSRAPHYTLSRALERQYERLAERVRSLEERICAMEVEFGEVHAPD